MTFLQKVLLSIKSYFDFLFLSLCHYVLIHRFVIGVLRYVLSNFSI